MDRAERRRTARRRYDRGAGRLRRRVRAGHDQWRRRAGNTRVSGDAARRLRPERHAHRSGAGQLRLAHRIEPAQSDDVGSGRSHGRQHETRACDVGRHDRRGRGQEQRSPSRYVRADQRRRPPAVHRRLRRRHAARGKTQDDSGGAGSLSHRAARRQLSHARRLLHGRHPIRADGVFQARPGSGRREPARGRRGPTQ